MTETTEKLETTEAKITARRDVKLRSGGLQTADHATTRWSATLPPEHVYKDLFSGAYWSIVARRISIDDIIEVRTEDQRFYAEMYVLDANQTQVIVKEMSYFDLQEDAEALAINRDPEYTYAWKGPAWRHCVIRISDGEVMAKNLGSKAEAYRWIAVRQKAA